MKNSDLELNLETLGKTQNEIQKKSLKLMHEHPIIEKIIAEHNITDEEIIDNLVDFLNIKDSLDFSNIYPYVYNVGRKNGVLRIKKIPAKNNFSKSITRSINLMLTEISNPDQNCKLSKIRLTTRDRKELIMKIKIIRSFLEKRKPTEGLKGLYVFGENGTGKTYIACAIANSFSSRGISSAYIRTNDLFSFLKSSMNENKVFDEIISTMKSVTTLIIDDIGLEKNNKWFKYEVLQSVIAARNHANKITVIFSPLHPQALEKYYINSEDRIEKHKAKALVYDLLSNRDIYCIDENFEMLNKK